VTHPSAPFRENWGKLTEKRVGVLLHYDASSSDASAIRWFTHPDSRVSYTWLVMDSGNVIPIAPQDKRAWHAGCCASDDPRLVYRDANSAFFGIALAATAGETATREAKRSIAMMCLHCFAVEGWPITEVWRIVSHRSQAVYCRGHPKAGQRGRKSDPEGDDLAHPVLNTNEIRGMVAARQIAA
jgi:N-acetyl-anhydromuramyl-L-alanine amidase AmpD